MNATSASPSMSRGGVLKATLIGFVLLIVVTALVIGIFGPAIAGVFAKGAIEREINPTIAGSVEVRGVKLSWGGPQELGAIEVFDASGQSLGTFEASAGASLTKLASGSMTLGEVALRRTDGTTLDEAGVSRLLAALASTEAPTGEPFALPVGLSGDFEVVLGSVRAQGVTLDEVRVDASLAGDGSVRAVAKAVRNRRDALRAEIRADSLVSDDGTLAWRDSGLRIGLDFDVEPDDVRAIVRTITGEDPGGDGALSVDTITLVERDGVLVQESEANVRGRLPERAAALLLAGDDSPLTIDGAPSFLIPIKDVRLPLPGDDGVIDLNAAQYDVPITIESIGATLTRADGTTEPVTLDPIRGSVRSDDGIRGARLELATNLALNGRPAGAWTLGADASGLIGESGALKTGGPERLNATLRAAGVPSAIAQAYLPPTFDTDAIVGEAINVDLEFLLASETDDTRGVELVGGQPHLLVSVAGDAGRAEAVLTYDGASVRGSTRVESDNGAALAAYALGGGGALRVTGDARATLVVHGINAPLRAGGIDLPNTSGTVSLDLDAPLTLRYADADPIELSRLSIPATLERDRLDFDIDALLDVTGRRASISGGGSVAGLFSGSPEPALDLQFDNVPTSVLGAVSDRAGAIAMEGLGETVTGSIGTDGSDPGAVHAELVGAVGTLHVQRVAIVDGALTLADARLETTRAGGVLRRTLGDERLALETGGTASLLVTDARVVLKTDRSFARLRDLDTSIALELAGVTGTYDGAPLHVSKMLLGCALTASGNLRVTMDTQGTFDGQPFRCSGPIELDRVHDGTGIPDVTSVKADADLSATLPAALLALVPDETIRAALSEVALDGPIELSLEGDPRAARGLGGLVLRGRAEGTGAHAECLIGTDSRSIVVGPVEGEFTLTPALFEIVSPYLADTPLHGAGLARAVPARVYSPETTVPLENRLVPDLVNVRTASVRIFAKEDLEVVDVASPWREGDVIERAVVKRFDVGYTYYDPILPEQPRIISNGAISLPDSGFEAPALAWSGAVALPVTTLLGEVLASASPEHLDALLKTDGFFERLFGSKVRLEYVGRMLTGATSSTQPQYQLTLTSDHLNASLPLWNSTAGGYEMRRAGSLWWRLRAPLATELFLGERERSAGVRFAEPIVVEAVIERLSTGPQDALLFGSVLELDTRFRADRLVIDDGTGNTDDLGVYTGRLFTDPSGDIMVSLEGVRQGAGPEPGGVPNDEKTLDLRARVSGFADPDGRPTPGQTRVEWLDLEGAMPTRLVDALGGTDGLIGALIGPRAFVDATIEGNALSDERTIRASFTGERATGEIPDGVITSDNVARIPDAQITVNAITNDASSRLIGVALPMFTAFEKTPDDEPMTISVTGLSVPLDGDVSQLNGTMRVDPGTMRFATRAFFGRLLELTNNNAQGQVGRRFEAFDLRLEDGVIRYDRITLPLGEVDVAIEGKVNLKSRRVNTVVWVPVSAVSDDLSAAARRIPGVQRLTMLPLRVRGPLSEPEVKLDEQMLIEGVPDAILGTFFEDLPQGVGGLLEELLNGGRDEDDER